MAYNDYGAFVFCDGMRRKDKEDAIAFADYEDEKRITELPNSHRIYASILDSLQKETKIHNSLYHAVLGDGDVRVCIYKGDVNRSCVLIKGETGISCLSGNALIGMLTGGAYDSSVFDYREDEDYAAREKRIKEYLSTHHVPDCVDEYGYLVPPFNLEFTINGNTIRFEERRDENDEAPAWYSTLPRLHASLSDVEGHSWDCWCDSLYGAGWVDDSLAPTDHNPSFKVMKALCVNSELPGYYVGVSLVADPDGNVLYQGERAYDGDSSDENTIDIISTLPDNSFVSANDFINILNMGISLHRKGIERVDNGYGIACSWFNSDDYVRDDSVLSDFVKTDDNGFTELDAKKNFAMKSYKHGAENQSAEPPFWFDYFPFKSNGSDNESECNADMRINNETTIDADMNEDKKKTKAKEDKKDKKSKNKKNKKNKKKEKKDKKGKNNQGK